MGSRTDLIWNIKRNNQWTWSSVNLKNREKKGKKNEQSLKVLWDNVGLSIYVQWASQKERKEERKNIWRNNGWKIPKFDEKINLPIPQNQQTPSKVSTKELLQDHHSETAKRQKQSEILKAAKKFDSLHMGEDQQIKWLISHPKQWNPEGSEWCTQNAEIQK